MKKIFTRLGERARTSRSQFVRPATAHCDTEDGPAMQDARRALQTGNANIALKWVHAEGEADVRAAFDAAVTESGHDVASPAARRFFETLVRVHRAGEGAGFDGIKPTGTALPAEVVAADAAADTGTLDPLRGLIAHERWGELKRRFAKLMAKKDYAVDDLDAARDYIAAYVHFFKYAEGHDDDDIHHHGHALHH